MKIPSLFRTPSNQQFKFSARHYDPIKEEIEERTERIRQELNAKKEGRPYTPNIRGRFNSREAGDRKASVIQLIIIAVLLLLGWGWWELGNDIIYVLFLALPVYFYFRLRKIFQKK